jgi:hypothetical protein
VTIWHSPAFIHGTKNYDTTAFPAACEGQTIVETNTRIVLTKQTSTRENGIWATDVDNEDGTWALARVSDWPEGATVEEGTVHYINVEYGDLRPPHLVIFHVQTDTLIWGGSMSTGSFAISTSLIPNHDVIDETIDPGDVFTYTPVGLSADNRAAVRITGVATLGEAYTAGIFEGETVNIPLDVAPLVDEDGATWYKMSGTATLNTSVEHQGTGCWRLTMGNGETSGDAGGNFHRNFTLPANHKARISAYALRASTPVCEIRCGYAYTTVGHYDQGSEYGNQTVQGIWTKHEFSIDSSTASRSVSLSLYGSTASSGTAYGIGYLDAIQFATTLDNFASRVYVDAEYYPGGIAPTYYPDDTQEEQPIDTQLQFGSTVMLSIDYSAECEIQIEALEIERVLKLTLLPTPVAELTTSPGLPATTTFPEYPY